MKYGEKEILEFVKWAIKDTGGEKAKRLWDDYNNYKCRCESIPVEPLVSPTEPTQPQQVFTVEEVKGWLKQQRANCANAFMDYDDYVYIKQCTKETISALKRVEILNAPEPKIIRTI